MWDLPDPGIEPVSPALVDGLFTTAPLGKPQYGYFKQYQFFQSIRMEYLSIFVYLLQFLLWVPQQYLEIVFSLGICLLLVLILTQNIKVMLIFKTKR